MEQPKTLTLTIDGKYVVFTHGQGVTAKIGFGTDLAELTDAKISICNYISSDRLEKVIFICQNAREGNVASDKLGYKYSWEVSSNLKAFGIFDLKLLPLDPNEQVTTDSKGDELDGSKTLTEFLAEKLFSIIVDEVDRQVKECTYGGRNHIDAKDIAKKVVDKFYPTCEIQPTPKEQTNTEQQNSKLTIALEGMKLMSERIDELDQKVTGMFKTLSRHENLLADFRGEL